MNYSFTELIQNRFQNSLVPSLVLNAGTRKESFLIRLLTGTVSITNNYTNEIFVQKTNYSKLGKEIKKIISTKPIRESLTNPLMLSDLDFYIRTSDHSNDVYYELLIDEICSYFFATVKDNHTTSFLHLYRIIEYISYSFPLIYSSYSRDYFGTFNRLKSYFETAKSELSFFEKFQEKIIDSSLLESELEIDFTTVDPILASKYYPLLKNILDPSNLKTDIPNSKISFEYQFILKLVITLRNRYFHFAIGGQRNIRSNEIIQSDIFFKLVNDEILNWITIIYFEILNHSVSQRKI